MGTEEKLKWDSPVGILILGFLFGMILLIWDTDEKCNYEKTENANYSKEIVISKNSKIKNKEIEENYIENEYTISDEFEYTEPIDWEEDDYEIEAGTGDPDMEEYLDFNYD